MPDKKLTDNEIKKALDVCVGIQNDCGDCPLLEYSQASDECMTELMSNALDLINRLQAENEDLKREREASIEDIHSLSDQVNEQQEEIDRLSILTELGNTRANDYRVMRDRALKAEAEVERLKKSNRNWRRKAQRLRAKAKAEAYKEFADRLKEHLKGNGGLYCVTTMNAKIDILVKEMDGDNNDRP